MRKGEKSIAKKCAKETRSTEKINKRKGVKMREGGKEERVVQKTIKREGR